jgi:hypothetical protein
LFCAKVTILHLSWPSSLETKTSLAVRTKMCLSRLRKYWLGGSEKAVVTSRQQQSEAYWNKRDPGVEAESSCTRGTQAWKMPRNLGQFLPGTGGKRLLLGESLQAPQALYWPDSLQNHRTRTCSKESCSHLRHNLQGWLLSFYLPGYKAEITTCSWEGKNSSRLFHLVSVVLVLCFSSKPTFAKPVGFI